MKRTSIFAAIIVAGCMNLSLHAQDETTETRNAGLAFLKVGVGARAVGMGESGVTLSRHGNSMFYNPAIIAREAGSSITIMHNERYEDVTANYLAATARLGSMAIGVHVNFSSVGEIEVRNTPGPAEGTTSGDDLSAGITAALPFGENLEVGASVKYLFTKIYTTSADGYAFDLGVRYRPLVSEDGRGLQFGAAVSNLGSMSEFQLESPTLPVGIRAGAGYSMPLEITKGTLSLVAENMYYTKDEKNHLHTGAEVSYKENLFLRLGYVTGFDIRALTFGLGASYSIFMFDFAYVPGKNEFGSTSTISLTLLL
ncbi:MAG: hypothetical protein CL946_12560 [Ectothiorhodospiraceae bacterium]|nr:hypothetical protein [Ectothiorhodospiraceae bacterium]